MDAFLRKIKKVLYYYSYTNFFVCVFINLPDEYSIVRSWEINTPVSNQKNYRFSLLKFSKFSLLFLHENTVVIAIFSYFIVAFRHPLEISFLLCGNSCIRNATFELQMRFLNFEMFKHWYYQQKPSSTVFDCLLSSYRFEKWILNGDQMITRMMKSWSWAKQ